MNDHSAALVSDAFFHALLEDAADEAAPGFPCLYRLSRPTGSSLDDLWLVWISKCFYRKPRTQVVYRDWSLAFATYWRDVNFNAAASEQPRYRSEDLLRRAILRCKEALKDKYSQFSKLKAASKVVFVQYVQPWDPAIPSLQKSAGDSDDLNCTSADSSSSSSEGSVDDLGSDEEGFASEDEGVEQGNHNSEAWDEAGDDMDIDPLYADILEDIRPRAGEDPFEEGLRLGKAYEEMRKRHWAEQERRKIMRGTVQAMEEKMQPLGALVAFMASASLNKFNTLRQIITYQAFRPFTYKDPETQEDIVVEPQLCSRAVFDGSSQHPLPADSLFTWTKAQLKRQEAAEARGSAIENFAEELVRILQEEGKPLPKKVVFISDLKHGRGNSFLLIHETPQDAAAVRCRELCVGSFQVRIHAVVNRRCKLRLSRGVNVPQLLSTPQDAAAQAKAMTEHVLGFFIDRVVPPWHICAGGERVLSEKAVRLKQLPLSVDEQRVKEWVQAEAGVSPSKVVRDNLARNSQAALAGAEGSEVTWIVELNGKLDCNENEADVQKVMHLHNRLLAGKIVKMERIRSRGAGGRFADPRQFTQKLLGDGAARGLLRPTAPEVEADEGISIEFTDGSSVVGNSVTGNRTRILSPAFAGGASKLDRTWDVIGGESKVWSAHVCLTESQRAHLLKDMPALQLGKHVSVANMRSILHQFLNETVLVHKHEDGSETRVRAPVRLVIGDIKSLCIHMGQDNKCPCCELPYDSYDSVLYGAKQRTPESNLARWKSHLDDVAKLMCTASCDSSFAASLTKVLSVPLLEERLERADSKMGLLEVRAGLDKLAGNLQGCYLFNGAEALARYDAEAELQPGYCKSKDQTRASILGLQGSVALLPAGPRSILLGRGLEEQLDLLASCMCEAGSGIGVDLSWIKKEHDMKELLDNVVEAFQESQEARRRYRQICEALKHVQDVQGLWMVLEDRELPGLGFRGKGESLEAAAAADLSPIAITRMQTLVKFIKARHGHVTGRPVDLLSSRKEREGAPYPVVVPGVMHTCQKVGKKVLKLLQKEAFGSAEGLSNKESNLEYVNRQVALVKTELLVKDEEKAGDSITLSMNCESIRLIFNRWREMFGDLLSEQWALIAELLSAVFSIIYSSTPPTSRSAFLLWILTNLTWNLTRILDQLASSKERKDRKPVVQSNHFHCFAAEIPRVYEALQPLLKRLGCLFHMLTEEAGEAYQKVAKVEGYNHSDRKTNVIDTMYRGEQMRDWAIMAYSTRAQDFSGFKKSNKRFAETFIPNLAIGACIYNSNTVFRSTFLSLAATLATKSISRGAFFVYKLGPLQRQNGQTSVVGTNLFSNIGDRSRTCSCTCFCKCRGCRQHCRCLCREGCSCLDVGTVCKCQELPYLIVLANGEDRRAFLPIRWCSVALPDHTVRQLVERCCQQQVEDEDWWQRASAEASGPSVLPASEFLRREGQLKIQATAKGFLLRKHLISTARLRLQVFQNGIMLSSVGPAAGPPTGGMRLTIRGRGFCVMGSLPPVVRIGPNQAADVVIQSDGILACLLPPGIGSKLTVLVIPQFEVIVPGCQGEAILLGGVGLRLTLEGAFSYDGPKVTSVQPRALPTQGGRLTIVGENLGHALPSIAAPGRKLLPTIARASHASTMLELDIGPGVGKSYQLELVNETGRTVVFFRYEEPVVEGVNVSGREVSTEGGSMILVRGKNFGPLGLEKGQHVKVGGAYASWALIEPHNLLEIRLPPSAGGRQPVIVSAGEYGSFTEQKSEITESCFLQYPPPKVLSCSQLRSPRDLVRVYGTDFGNEKSCLVNFGGVVVAASLITHHREVSCVVPEVADNQKGTQKVEVKVCGGGQWSEKGVIFEYKAAPKATRKRAAAGDETHIPTAGKAASVFVQWRLAVRWSALHQDAAAIDVHGKPFTPESVAAAIREYEAFETFMNDRTRVSKSAHADLFSAMRAAWAQERRRRNLPETSEQNTVVSKKRQRDVVPLRGRAKVSKP